MKYIDSITSCNTLKSEWLIIFAKECVIVCPLPEVLMVSPTIKEVLRGPLSIFAPVLLDKECPKNN
jgi:hypothetical protein